MTASKSHGPLIVEQAEDGYRYSTEPFLLADFVRPGPGASVLDVGAGCGIIPLLLASRQRDLKITAVEIQEPLCELARRNVLQNGFSGSIQTVLADFSRPESFPRTDLFDLVVSNPPYRKMNSGRLNPDRGKAIARHELTLTLAILAKNGGALLKPGGRIALAYPPRRLEEVRAELVRQGLTPCRLRCVHGRPGTEAKIVLIEAVKGFSADCAPEQPLYIYNADGSYTLETQQIYASFDYSGRSHRCRQKLGRPGAG
ncbi:MAG: methyltransferase [Nitrospinae bacterium]|nr:methyltransferase [Nitrospinota bacterium]